MVSQLCGRGPLTTLPTNALPATRCLPVHAFPTRAPTSIDAAVGAAPARGLDLEKDSPPFSARPTIADCRGIVPLFPISSAPLPKDLEDTFNGHFELELAAYRPAQQGHFSCRLSVVI